MLWKTLSLGLLASVHTGTIFLEGPDFCFTPIKAERSYFFHSGNKKSFRNQQHVEI